MDKIFFFLLLLSIVACNNDSNVSQETIQETVPAQHPSEATPPATRSTNTPGTPPADSDLPQMEMSPEQQQAFDRQRLTGYINLLSGDWQSITNVGTSLKINAERIEQLENDAVNASTPYELYIDCNTSEACKIGKVGASSSCCIITEDECYVVKRVNSKELQLIKASDKTLSTYVKM